MLIPFLLFASLVSLSAWARYLTTMMIILTITARALGGLDNIELTLHGDLMLNTTKEELDQSKNKKNL
jgi:hypothetical protein